MKPVSPLRGKLDCHVEMFVVVVDIMMQWLVVYVFVCMNVLLLTCLCMYVCVYMCEYHKGFTTHPFSDQFCSRRAPQVTVESEVLAFSLSIGERKDIHLWQPR